MTLAARISEAPRPCLDEPCPARARIAMIEANVGFSPDEAARLQNALGPDFDQSLQADAITRRDPHECLSLQAIDAELEALSRHWLARRADPSQGGWSISLAGAAMPDGAARFVPEDGATFLLPRLPWAAPTGEGVIEDARYRVTGAGSSRGIDVFDPATDRVVVNVKRSLPHLAERRRGGSRERLKRRAIRWAFGLEDAVDTSLLTRLDALYGLSMTGHAARLAQSLPTHLHLLPEPLAAADLQGHAAVFRPSPESLDPRARHAVPLFALCHGRSARRNLLAEWGAAGIVDPVSLALDCAGYYLAGWIALLRAGIIMTMPHAQNAFLLLDDTGAPCGFVLKDLRDMDLLSRYRALSHGSIRLQGICRAYLDYEMFVHPIYFDTTPLSRRPLTEALFNFTFFMLRNHVLRGLEASLTEPHQVAKYRRGTSAMLNAAADGASPDEVALVREGGGANPLSAIRRLRQRLVPMMEAA